VDEDLEALADGDTQAAPPGAKPDAAADLEALAAGFERSESSLASPRESDATQPAADIEALAAGFEAAAEASGPRSPADAGDLEALAAGFEASPDASPHEAKPVPDFEELVEAFEEHGQLDEPHVPESVQPARDLEDLAEGFEPDGSEVRDVPDSAKPERESQGIERPATEASGPETAAPGWDEPDLLDELERLASGFDSIAPPAQELGEPIEDLESFEAGMETPAHPASEVKDATDLAGALDPVGLAETEARLPEPETVSKPPAARASAGVSALGDWSDLDELADEFAELSGASPTEADAPSAGAAEREAREVPPGPPDSAGPGAAPALGGAVEAWTEEPGTEVPSAKHLSEAEEWEDEDRVLIERSPELLASQPASGAGASGAEDDALEELADVFEGEEAWDGTGPGPALAIPEREAGAEALAAIEAPPESTMQSVRPVAEPDLEASGTDVGQTSATSAGPPPPVPGRLSEPGFEPPDLQAEPAAAPEPSEAAESVSQILAAEEARFLDGFAEVLGAEVPETSPEAPVAEPDTTPDTTDSEAPEPGLEAEAPPGHEALPELAVPESEPAPRLREGLLARFAPSRAGAEIHSAPPTLEQAPPAEVSTHEAGLDTAEFQEVAEAAGESKSEVGPAIDLETEAELPATEMPTEESTADSIFEEPEVEFDGAEEPVEAEAGLDAGSPAPVADALASMEVEPAPEPRPAEAALEELAAAAAQPGAPPVAAGIQPAAAQPPAEVPETALMPSAAEPVASPPRAPVYRSRVRLTGILAKSLVLIGVAGAGIGGYIGYETWIKPRLSGHGGPGTQAVPLAPIEIPPEPVSEASLRRALAARPEDPSGYEALATWLEANGRKDEAAVYRSFRPARAQPAATAAGAPAATPAAVAPVSTPAQPVPTAPASASEIAAALVAQGRQEEAQGLQEKALETYSRALQADPRSHDALLRKGSVLARIGSLDQAFETLSQLLVLHPKSAVGHNALGLVVRQQATSIDGVLKAISLFREAIELDPDLTAAHTNLGSAYEAAGDAQQALEMRRRAVQLDPRNAEAHAQLGLSFLSLDRPEEARAELEEAIRLDPDEGIYHSNLGYWFVVQGQTEAALPHYREALELQPDNAEHHSELGSALLLLKRYEESVAAFQRAIELAPRNAFNYSNMAFAKKAIGRTGEALSLFEQAAALAPEDSQIQLGMAGVLEELRQTKQAVAAYKRAIQFDGCNYVASYNLAVLLQNRGIRYRDDAISEWNRYLEMVERCGIAGQEDFIRQAKASLKELDY
jgi:tetratricopeptide (TPR) repeat protein